MEATTTTKTVGTQTWTTVTEMVGGCEVSTTTVTNEDGTTVELGAVWK